MQIDMGGILFDANVCLILLALHRGDREQAMQLAHSLSWVNEDGHTVQTPLYALAQLLEGKRLGLSEDESAARLSEFVPEDRLMWARNVLTDPLGMLPSLKCYHCEDCAFKAACGYTEARRLRRALKDYMLRSKS
jgi:hypothetical protein